MSQSEQDRQAKNGVGPAGKADPEVVPMARRRQFSRAYKLRILAEVEQCQWGEVGALLRREGLYSSVLSKWRQQKTAGKLDQPTREANQQDKEQAKELRQLQRENARLQAELAKAEAIIEVQKKLSTLLEAMRN
jgi:transposase-like protein